MYSYSEIALIHDTRHVRTRFRVDGIKAMSLANRINRGRVCLHCQKGTTILLLQNVQFQLRQVFTPFLIAVRTSTVTTASRKETIIPSSHYLPLSSLKWNVLRFLFCRMSKLDRDFLPSVKLRDIAFILSVPKLRANGCNNSSSVASVCTGLKVLPVSNFAQQLPTTHNNMQQAVQTTQHVTSIVGQQCKDGEYREEGLYGQSVHLYSRSKFE